jgi:hypothetical protein
MNRVLSSVKQFGLPVVVAASLQACGGGSALVDATATAASADATTSTSSSSATGDTASDGGVARLHVLAAARAVACAAELGSSCVAASPVLDTTPSSWSFAKTGSGSNGVVDRAGGLVSANALALNYQFSCYASAGVECARVSAIYAPSGGIATGSFLAIALKGPLNADVRVNICDTAGQCFEYAAARASTASAGSWSQLFIDLSRPLSRSNASASAKLGATARSVSIVSVSPASGSQSGWLEIDGIQFISPAASTAATAAAGPSTVAPVVTAAAPLVFNASDSAKPGDLVTIQGARFGDAPRVTLENATGGNLQTLAVVNKVGTSWLTVAIPSNATGALMLRVNNGASPSAAIALNAAVAHHLDTTTLSPDGAFRVFGRSLMLAGYTPVVRIGGTAASVDLARSNENMLVVTAPGSLQATSAAVVTVENGSGSAAVALDRRIAVRTGTSGDAFGLGTGWASAFSAFSGRTIYAASDSRLSYKTVCDNQQDAAWPIQTAIDLAASNAGGVVQLPAGTCYIGSGLTLRSNVVLQGAGKDATTLRYGGNYPLYGQNIDLAGVRNLSLVNAGPVQEGPLIKESTRVFLQNLRIDLKTSRQSFMTDNVDMVVAGSDFIQSGSINENGPYLFNNTAGLIFTGNTTTWVMGANSFGRVHDAFISGNTFTRDATVQNAAGTIHSLTLDFAHRVAVVGNTFNVKNGPIGNTTRNDGETLLSEGGGASRTENVGSVTASDATSLTDSANTLNVDPFSTGAIPENYGIAVVSGAGAGQHRRVTGYANGRVTVDRAWDVVPEPGSRYASFVWGLEKSMLKNNVLSQNPRGIWLYQTAIRDVAVIGNSISEGGGIYLRAYQNLASRMLTPMYNVRIAGNVVRNTGGQWMSYVSAIFVNADARAFGTAMTGIEVRNNQLQTHTPNLSSSWEEYAGNEGFFAMTRFENYASYEASASPRILGTLFQANTCTNCDVGVRLGTGAAGTVLWNNPLVNSPSLWADWATGSSAEKSVGTLVQ